MALVTGGGDRRLFLTQLLALALAPALRAQSPVSPPRFVQLLLEAYNTGRPGPIRTFAQQMLAAPLIERLRGIDAIVTAQLDDYAAYGPLTIIEASGGPPGPPFTWTRGEITGAYVGLRASGASAIESLMRVEGVRPVTSTRALPASALGGAIERYFRRSADAQHFRGAVRVEQGGTPVFEGAFGLADDAAGRANTLTTAFNVASCGKMFTAAAVMQLVDAGRIALDAPVSQYLRRFDAAFASQHTVRHLLTHGSALTRDVFDTAAYQAERHTITGNADYVRLADWQTGGRQPGARFNYQNGGYIALGAIVEAVAGEPFEEVLQARIFRPAGMRTATFVRRDALDSHHARGYRFVTIRDDGTIVRADNTETLPGRGSAAGGMYCAVGDMARFVRALSRGDLVSRPAFELMTTVVYPGIPDPSGGTSGYGFGVEVVNWAGGRQRWGHRGGARGVSARVDVYPWLDTTVVVLANIDTAANAASMALRDMLVDDTTYG